MMIDDQDRRPNGDAFSLYLEARAEWNRRTPASMRRAIHCLEQAVALNGSFALACAAMADCYSILLDYGILSPREGLTQARLAAGRALHLAPELAESLTSAAIVRQMHLDWKTAEVEFRTALRAHPGYAVARQRFGLFLAWMGRPDEARREIAAAGTLDPHAPAIAASHAWVEYYGGNIPEAVAAAERVLARHPDFSSARAVLSLALVRAGEPARAAALLEEALSPEEEDLSLLSLLAYALGRAGRTGEAAAAVSRMRARASAQYVSPYALAVALLGAGEEGEALDALREAEANRCPQLVYLFADPLFDALRKHSEFHELLVRLRLPYKGVGETARVAGGVA